MIHAGDLFCRVMSTKASQSYREALDRIQQEPWLAGSLRVSAERRLRKALGLPDSWNLGVLPNRAAAICLIARSIVARALAEGGAQVALRDDVPRDWWGHLALFEPLGLILKSSPGAGQLSKRCSSWVQGWVNPETGRMNAPEPSGRDAQQCAVIFDLGVGIANIPVTADLWLRDWSCCGWVVCSMEPLLGKLAPTIICSQWEDLGPYEDTDAAAMLAAAIALEEASVALDGLGFESARRRAGWEERLRQIGGIVADEAAERLPGMSAVMLPGRSGAYLDGFLRHRGIWPQEIANKMSRRLGGQTLMESKSSNQSSYELKRVRDRSTLRVAASEGCWAEMQSLQDDFFSALKRSEKLSEGLSCWPIVVAAEDENRFQPRVMQRAYRPLYAGQLKPEYAVGGLRLVAADCRAFGLEGRLGLLVDEEDGVIVDAAYQAFGPPTWIALAEILCEQLIRKPYVEADRIGARAIEEALTDGSWELAAAGRRWLNLWLEAIEGCLGQCSDIECLTAAPVTPMSLEGLEPGEPYPGWEQMDEAQRRAVIEAVLDADVRPYIAMDAGGISIQRLDGMVLRVAYSGSCTSCPSSIGSTLHAIQQTLRSKVHPELMVIPEFEPAVENS